ncbi:hypothetical protein RND71_039243 [Anisodus tanguticus]|uniref:Legumain prodomain domain-containing protein n=1 Tax=Anisodus tanguticus TaxID=243964 RepID=A0AAE1QZ77_9SOLA|nr:hypothetical protein RND71_039243 [Anisodus tanguticus]
MTRDDGDRSDSSQQNDGATSSGNDLNQRVTKESTPTDEIPEEEMQIVKEQQLLMMEEMKFIRQTSSTFFGNPNVGVRRPRGTHPTPTDYVGEDVNAEIFYNVILAKKSGIVGGSGKVLNSGPNDHIFIYYTDHGGPGIVSMPNGENVFANDLVDVLKKKHASGTYDRVIPAWLSVLLTEFQGVCLGDLYSVAWMEDSDVQDRDADSVQGQQSRVANRTAANITYGDYGSHVKEYGDLVVSFDPLSAYMGEASTNRSHAFVDTMSFSTSSSRNVDQCSTELFYLFTKHQNAPEGSHEKYEAHVKLNEVISQRTQVDNNVKHLGELLFGVEKGKEVLHSVRPAGQPLVDNWDCLKSFNMTTLFSRIGQDIEARCGRLTPYGRKHVRGIANICNAGITSEKMAATSARACSS